MFGRTGWLQRCLVIGLALGAFLPVAGEVAAAFGPADACGCDAAAACPMRAAGGGCTAGCRHGADRPDGLNADCGCRHPAAPGAVAGSEMPALPGRGCALDRPAEGELATGRLAVRPSGHRGPPDLPPPRPQPLAA